MQRRHKIFIGVLILLVGFALERFIWTQDVANLFVSAKEWLLSSRLTAWVIYAALAFCVWKLLRLLFTKPKKSAQAKAPNAPVLTLRFINSEAPKGSIRPSDYVENPPYPTEIKAVSLEEIIRKYQVPIKKLADQSGLSDDDKEELLLPAIEAAICIVHMLPASEQDHHSYEGGLLTHTLEVAMNAAVAAQNHIFDAREFPGQKYENRRRWVLAAILAGLAHDFGKVINDINVVNADTHEKKRMDLPMQNWIEKRAVRAYSIFWRSGPRPPKSHQEGSFFLLRSILSDEIVNFLCFQGNPNIYKALRDAVYDQTGPLGTILADADARSASDDRVHRKKIGIGTHSIITQSANAFCRGVARLIEKKAWSVNRRDSHVFVTREGAFLVWRPLAERELEQMLKEIANAIREVDASEHIERNANLVLEKLITGNVLLPTSKSQDWLWNVCPIVCKTVYIPCLRLTDAHLILGQASVPSFIEAHVYGEMASLHQITAWAERYGYVPQSFFMQKSRMIYGREPMEVIRNGIDAVGVKDVDATFAKVHEILLADMVKADDPQGFRAEEANPAEVQKVMESMPVRKAVIVAELDASAHVPDKINSGCDLSRLVKEGLESKSDNPENRLNNKNAREAQSHEEKAVVGSVPSQKQQSDLNAASAESLTSIEQTTNTQPSEAEAEHPKPQKKLTSKEVVAQLINEFVNQLKKGEGELLSCVENSTTKRYSRIDRLIAVAHDSGVQDSAIVYSLKGIPGMNFNRDEMKVSVFL